MRKVFDGTTLYDGLRLHPARGGLSTAEYEKDNCESLPKCVSVLNGP
jgi:hypothetical protein